MSGDPQQFKYDAFISYRHCEPDRTIAVRLQTMLEKYKLPKALAARIGDKKLHFFRDEDELPTSSNLSAGIDEALVQSRYLICICSPAYLESRWCMQEINRFKEQHGGSNANIIPLVAVAGDDPTLVFPEQLTHETRYYTDASGVRHAQEVAIEPLAGNVAAPTVKESLKKLKIEALRIAAPLFGIGFNDLFDRDKRRRARRTRGILIASFAAISLIAVYSSVMFLRIFRQNQLIGQQSLELYDNSIEMAMDAGRQLQSVQYAREAMEMQLQINGETNPETERVLAKAAAFYDPAPVSDVRTHFSIPGGVLGWQNNFYNTDGSALIVTEWGKTHVLDALNGTERFSFPTYDLALPDNRFADKKHFYVIEGLVKDEPESLRVVAYDLLTGKERWDYVQKLPEHDELKAYLTGHDEAGAVALVVEAYGRVSSDYWYFSVYFDAETGENTGGEDLGSAVPGGRMVMQRDGSLRFEKFAEEEEEEDASADGRVLARYDEGRYVRQISDTEIELHSTIPSMNYRPLYGEDGGFSPYEAKDLSVYDYNQTRYAVRDDRFACLVRHFDLKGIHPRYLMREGIAAYEIPVYDTAREELLATIEINNDRDIPLYLFGVRFTDADHLIVYGWTTDWETNGVCLLYRTDGTLCDEITFPYSEEDVFAGYADDPEEEASGFLETEYDASLLVMTDRLVYAEDERLVEVPFHYFVAINASVRPDGTWAACVMLRDGGLALAAGEYGSFDEFIVNKRSTYEDLTYVVPPALSPDGAYAAVAGEPTQEILVATVKGGEAAVIPVEEHGIPDAMLFPDNKTLFALWEYGEIRGYDIETGEEICCRETWSNPVGTNYNGMERLDETRIIIYCNGYGLVTDTKTLEIRAELPYFLAVTDGGKKVIARVEYKFDERMDKDRECYHIGNLLDTDGLLLLSKLFLQSYE